jgi:hypothetical protein
MAGALEGTQSLRKAPAKLLDCVPLRPGAESKTGTPQGHVRSLIANMTSLLGALAGYGTITFDAHLACVGAYARASS